MKIFLLTFLIFLLAVLGLAIGWLFSNRSLKGSCGGLSAIPGMENAHCSCSNPCEKRKQKMAQEAALKQGAAIE
ncbi:(Na+)-NQR maturation NqrM [Candidatus Thiothrix sp. Deng01]|uniref:(Na+)-NQR maturation NqrM n=1 Tax=Candidatus Thiothrix phosphatis TaxID=3112415 RepID=A0ABU6CV32_9GAMM|nr:(Na+)-NQR maturation NqrM [Candidatus Thiothrix sp. Deng01]MEB4590660.1 (Na+)-NQR maturation NqrM [Candidatus Thiothrix sp. Deng01]